jgi:phospholipid/cholesterol/gamma-HCH transport system substrate-binding protein
MESRSHAFAAGLFTLFFVAAMVAAGWWLARSGQDYDEPYVIVSETAVSGLAEQAPVRYLGVEVGRVERIRFDPQRPRRILIRISIDSDALVTDRTYAQLGYQGVTGLSYVQLQEDGDQGRELRTSRRAPAEIRMRPSALQEFSASGQELVTSARVAADRLAEILSAENQRRISATIGNVEEATRQFAEIQRAVGPAIRQLPSLSQQLQSVLERADLLVGNINDLTEEARKNADTLDSVRRTAGEVGALAAEVHDVTLPRTNRLMDRLSRTSDSLDALLRAQRSQPLILGPTPAPPGPGEPGFDAPAGGDRR